MSPSNNEGRVLESLDPERSPESIEGRSLGELILPVPSDSRGEPQAKGAKSEGLRRKIPQKQILRRFPPQDGHNTQEVLLFFLGF